MEIYLDNAATTKAYDEVGEVVKKVMCEDYGNPSSKHIKGVEGENYIKDAKEIFARLLKVDKKEIFFTSGGTESDNLAIMGGARANKRRGNHLITSVVEHSAVYNAFARLEEEGFEVTYLKVGTDGRVNPGELKAALRDDTILVSIMHVNNEIGSIMPIGEIGKIIKSYNKDILFHVDGIQAFGKLEVHLKKLSADMYSISGHKFHGPKGVGVLYIKEGTRLQPIILGGGQQNDMRSGTENVPGIAGIACAAGKIYADRIENTRHIRALRNKLVEGIKSIEGTVINGADDEYALANIVSAGFAGIRGEVLLHALEEKHIYVSSGSACSSNHPAISGVLKAIESDNKYLDSTIRFSFNENNTSEEVEYTLETLNSIVPMLRKYTRS